MLFELRQALIFVPGLLSRSRRDTVRRVGEEISTGQRWRQQYEEHSLNRARFWPHAGNHTEPWEETRNRAYFHARNSDLLPKPPVQKSARLDGFEIAQWRPVRTAAQRIFHRHHARAIGEVAAAPGFRQGRRGSAIRGIRRHDPVFEEETSGC